MRNKAAYDEYVSTHKDVIDDLNKANSELADKTKAYNEAKEDAAKTDKEYQAAQDELTKLNNHIEDLSTAITNYESKIKQLNSMSKPLFMANYFDIPEVKDFTFGLAATTQFFGKPDISNMPG